MSGIVVGEVTSAQPVDMEIEEAAVTVCTCTGNAADRNECASQLKVISDEADREHPHALVAIARLYQDLDFQIRAFRRELRRVRALPLDDPERMKYLCEIRKMMRHDDNVVDVHYSVMDLYDVERDGVEDVETEDTPLQLFHELTWLVHGVVAPEDDRDHEAVQTISELSAAAAGDDGNGKWSKRTQKKKMNAKRARN